MYRNVLIITSFLLLLLGCKGNSVNKEELELEDHFPFIFRMNAFATDAEKYLSFPILFNDSIIKAQGIKKITRSLFFVEPEDTINKEDFSIAVPRERRIYFFEEHGQIKSLKVVYFYDDQEIGELRFEYKSLKSKYGYSLVEKIGDPKKIDFSDEEHMDFPFFIHREVKKTNKYLAYQDVESGDYLFFMMNRKYWGPLSVDSILNPTRRDQVVLGNPYFPLKRYKVQNKVNETDVEKVIYDGKTKFVKTIIRQEYPFETKRSIIYAKSGLCTGYIDSTFSGKLFLTRVVSEMDHDAKERPVKITHRKENSMDNSGQISIELISYE
jgi:hypothetical protein